MKPLAALVLMLALAVTSLGAPSIPLAKKESLRKILDSKFVLTSVPKEKEEDFYQILEAFAETKRSREFVRRVEFVSDHEANLDFLDGGMHGGGTATLKKKDERWGLEQKMYFL